MTAHPNQRMSSSSKWSISRAVLRSEVKLPGSSATSPTQNAIAAPMWIDFHITRFPASWANAGR